MARRATLKDVAERAQVSTATVSYVLNDKKSISEQTKTRVYDAIRDLIMFPISVREACPVEIQS